MRLFSLKAKKHLPVGKLTKKTLAILLFVFYINLFFFRPFGSVALVFLTVGFVFLISRLFLQKKYLQKNFLTISGIFLAIFLSLLNLLVTANSVANLSSIILIIFCLFLFVYLSAFKLSFVNRVSELITIPFCLLKAYLWGSLKTITLFFPKRIKKQLIAQNNKKKLTTIRTVLRGILIAIPILIILILLLTSADPIFSSFIDSLFKIEIPESLILRLRYSALIFLLLTPLVFFRLKKRCFLPVKFFKKFTLIGELTVVQTLVALTVALFLIVQWPYIFVDVPFETDLSRFGVATYSEYVKKGFNELTLVAFILLALLWAGLIFIKIDRKNSKKTLFSLQLLILFELVVFISSIFRRIWLYQLAHGWSLARIYGGFWLVWLIGMVVGLAGRHFWQKNWVIAELTFSVCLLLFIGFFKTESFILSHPPTVNNQVDYIYLSRLTADGYQGWQQAFDYAYEVLTNDALFEKDLINKEERRKIAYAGIVLRQLTKKYHQLIRNYGSKKEFDQYRLAVLNFNQNQALPDQSKEQKNKLDIKNPQLEINIVYWGYPNLYSQFNTKPRLSFYSITLQKEPVYKLYPNFDRFLVWNQSRAKAYQQLKLDIGFQQLLNLQGNYWQLHEKIFNQPEEERGYDTDISFKSPFLQSVTAL